VVERLGEVKGPGIGAVGDAPPGFEDLTGA
jgi:hypothetical protein